MMISSSFSADVSAAAPLLWNADRGLHAAQPDLSPMLR
jgi:hypothetical protein